MRVTLWMASVALLFGVLAANLVPNGLASADSATPLLARVTWSQPQRVLSGQFTGVSEVVDSTNHVHIAVTGRGGVWYVTDRSGTWTQRRILANLTNTEYVAPSIALDEKDHVFIAVMRVPTTDVGDQGIYYVTDKGRARGSFPTSPTMIAPPDDGEPSLKVSHGHLFLAYVNGWCCVGDGEVQVRTNATGRWTVAHIARGQNPSLRVGSDGRPRVAFDSGWDPGIHYAVAASASGRFSVTTVPGTDATDGTYLGPALALDLNNRPHIAWFGAGGIRYDWRSATGWHGPARVATYQGVSYMAFDLDTLGRPNIVLGGRTMRHELLVGGAWHETTVATQVDVAYVAIRRAFNGHTVIAWADNGGGIWLSRN